MSKRKWMVIGLLLAVVSVGFAQRGRFRGWGRHRAMDIDAYREYTDFPSWKNQEGFDKDTFTFARVIYDSWGEGGWGIDYPDSDLNFSLRLQQLTSIKVNPVPVKVRLSDEAIFQYPLLYMIEPGGIHLDDEEVAGLRKYCHNGGFLLVDDFWGDWEWNVFHEQIRRVFPEREVVDVEVDHEIFHMVYDLDEKPQIPSIRWMYDGRTWEPHKGPGSRDVHYRAIMDDEDRIMVFICHNTDLGDGWEREGENREYFERFSVKKAYPMGINIITYAMTH